ncbi:MAG: hypothetical protein ACYC66_13375 [Chloroflexota bacterium]
MTDKEKLYRLIDELPEGELLPAERFLEYLRDRARDAVLRAFMEAPEDDEPLTDEELAAIREGEKAVARGEVKPWEEVKAEIQEADSRRKRKKAS